jgi:hypothetical protein
VASSLRQKSSPGFSANSRSHRVSLEEANIEQGISNNEVLLALPGNHLQSWIPHNPSTFCGSLFDIRYSVKLAFIHIEIKNWVQTFAGRYWPLIMAKIAFDPGLIQCVFETNEAHGKNHQGPKAQCEEVAGNSKQVTVTEQDQAK